MGDRTVFDVELSTRVQDYLEAIPPNELSPGGLLEVVMELTDELEKRSDELLRLFPLSHESLLFNYQIISGDSGYFHDFRFVVDTSASEFGIVRVVYVEREYPPERLVDIINSLD